MKTIAVVANVVQLAVILLIFFIRGLDLGGPVIGMLFLLLAVPFINGVYLFLTDRPRLEPPPAGQTNGLIKREAMRVHYPDDRCPTLSTGGSTFAVRDLSEGGVRIRAASATPFKRRIKGDLRLLCGERLRFSARVLRREGAEVVFRFSSPIGTATLVEEKRLSAADRG